MVMVVVFVQGGDVGHQRPVRLQQRWFYRDGVFRVVPGGETDGQPGVQRDGCGQGKRACVYQRVNGACLQ